MGWEDSFLPAALNYIEGKPIPKELLFEERQSQMTPNHDCGRRVMLACSGNVDQFWGWLIEQRFAHQGQEQLSTTYSEHYEVYMSAGTLACKDIPKVREVSMTWWDQHAALYRLVADPRLTQVVTPGSRCNRPHNYSQGGVLRLLLGKPTKHDLQVASREKEPAMWAVRTMMSQLELRRTRVANLPQLAYPLIVWRHTRFHFAWSPYLRSPHAYPQYAVYWEYERKADFGDEFSLNPSYIRGKTKGSRLIESSVDLPKSVLPWLTKYLQDATLYVTGPTWQPLDAVRLTTTLEEEIDGDDQS